LLLMPASEGEMQLMLAKLLLLMLELIASVRAMLIACGSERQRAGSKPVCSVDCRQQSVQK
jgi:hypothetical protein